MRKVVKASYSPTQRVHEIIDILVDQYNVSEHELLMQCLDWFPSDDLVRCFEDYARLADINLDDREESEYAENPRELDEIWDSYYGSDSVTGKTEICGNDTRFDVYVVDVIHEVDPGHDTAGPEAAEEIYTIQAISPEEAIERAIKVWGEPYDDVRILAVNPDDADEVDIPFDFKDDDAKYYKNKLENDWAAINEDYYRKDAEDAYRRKY